MTVSSLADAIARANLHGDPLQPVLEHIEASIARLEKIGEREALSDKALAQLCRFAAVGAQANVVEMIRATDRLARVMRLTQWVVSLLAAAGAGYALHP